VRLELRLRRLREGKLLLPEGSICDVGLGQCCDGFTCVVFCVAL
jgi:hypothetical protein